jgi:signal transduction histidine kinase
MAASDLDREISSRTILEMSLHELNNDVLRVRAVVSALRASPTFTLMTAADREAIAALEEAAHRLQTRQQMVSELVVWMRLPEGSEPKHAALDLDRAVEGWITAEARHRDRIMHTRSSVPVVVRGSEAAIATILDNLVGNAVKYGARHVRLRVITTDGVVTLLCEDDGPGFGEGEIPHAFELGYRGPSQASCVPGTGAGLAGCELLAKWMSAEIHVANVPGGGALVSLAFPAIRTPEG